MNQQYTLAATIDHWLTFLFQEGKSPHTIAAYRYALAHFVTWLQRAYGEASVLAALQPRDVRDWKTYQQITEHAAPATINQRLAALSCLCQWAITHDRLVTDPTSTIHGVPPPLRQPKALRPQVLRKLLRSVHTTGTPRDCAILELLAGTGIRVGELLAIGHDDLVLHDRSGTLTIRAGKGGSYRIIPLSVDVRHALRAYLATFPAPPAPAALFWQGRHGTFGHRSSVLRILRRYTSAAGVPSIGPHILRHTFATRYLEANPGDLRGLAALLGHASLATVMIYTEPTLDDLAARVERMERHLPPEDHREEQHP